jgi:hypothetical protein
MPLLAGAAGYTLRPGEPHSRIRNHNESVGQPVCVPFEQSPEDFNLIGGALIFKPHENDTPMRAPLPINLLAKSLSFVIRIQRSSNAFRITSSSSAPRASSNTEKI